MNSLSRRLTFTHTSVALLAVLLMALLSGGLLARAYLDLARQQSRTTAQRISRVVGMTYQRNRGWVGIEPLLEQRFTEALITRRVVITDLEQRVVYDNLGILPAGTPLPAQLRDTTVPIMMRRPPRGGAVIGYVSVPTGLFDVDVAERGLFENVIRIGIIGSCASSLAALFIALLVVRRVTAPLSSMTRAAQRIASGERYEPLPIPQDRELAELAQSFNTMAAELERQEQLRRQLVADIAHELRTPLSVLRLQIESIEDGVSQPTPEMLASLGHEVNLLTRLVNDLRLLSLVDAGQLSLQLEAVDGQAVLQRVLASAMPHARQQQITLRLTASAPDVQPVWADRERLAQVLGNLVENALRYTPAGGWVDLSIASSSEPPAGPLSGALPAAPLPEQGRQWVVFGISDSGVGIAAEDLPHIFDRFYRADRARTRESGGSGLGLAIVQRLVEAQGGRVAVSSVVGQGTTFRVYLPSCVPCPPCPKYPDSSHLPHALG